MIKQDVLKRMGGFDPDLPTNGKDGGYGFSDDDFSLRFRLAGYKSLVANDVFIHHFGSMTTRQYRPDLFGVPQNINKDKYFTKLQRNDRVTIGPHGEITVAPYGLDDLIPVAENTVIRSPRICIIANDAAGRQVNYSALAASYHGAAVSFGENSIQRLFTQMMTSSEYDFVVLIADRLAPAAEKVQALVETALCFPDVAIMVPTGNFAPKTHAHCAMKEQGVEIIQYADMSCCVINVKLIRPFMPILTQYGSDEEFYWFFQRRIRGEGYFIARAHGITVDADAPCNRHPYDSLLLPEQLVKENKYAEAIAIYKDDLAKDPTFAESHYQLAHIAKVQHHTTDAANFAVSALRIDRNHIQSLILLSKIFLEQGDLKHAESIVGQANFKQPGNPEVQALVAEYEKVISNKPTTANIPPTAAVIASYQCGKTQKGPIPSKKNKSKRRETSVRKVLLITPPFEAPHRSEGIQLDSHYPIGMACLSASLKQAGHNVTLLFLNDFPYERCALIVANHIAVDKPDIVGFNMLSPNRVMCYELMDYIHSTYPSIKIAVGGIHATAMYDQLKERFPYADILKGECDYSFVEYCKTGQVTEIPVDDLNDLPIPDHAAFWNPYRTTVSLMTSRGCPYSCSFCVLEHISKRKVRYKSPEKVIEEIEYCCKALPGVKRFWIHDDNFLLDNKRAKEICRLIIEKGLNHYIYMFCKG